MARGEHDDTANAAACAFGRTESLPRARPSATPPAWSRSHGGAARMTAAARYGLLFDPWGRDRDDPYAVFALLLSTLPQN
ncbi:hypothetical protein GCM10010278_75650 [Streptomyces melanogenes]|nr:hypothetical protein GCM10010278_75650 [Streptomyces melanogenes]